jgi:hypothetical protein
MIPKLFLTLFDYKSFTPKLFSRVISSLGLIGLVILLTLFVTPDTYAASPTPMADPNVPNQGDGNGDGIPDSSQLNVVSLPDKVSGNYVTLEVSPSTCPISDAYTDLAETQPDYNPRYLFPQGLVYFEIPCPQVQISIYYHALSQVTPNLSFQKFGPITPGDVNTLGWYAMPNVTFAMVKVGDHSVVKATYTLTDGVLGDDTGVDGRIVDAGGSILDTNFENVVGLWTKTYTASVQVGTVTITVNRNGVIGTVSVDYTTNDNTAIAGQDYQTTSGTLSWAADERGDKTFTVPVLPGATIGRTFGITLTNLTSSSNSTLGINLATVTLNNDPPPVSPTTPGAADNFMGFSTKTFTASRNVGTATIIVNRNGTRGALAVDYATGDNTALAGRDYQTVTGTLSWAEGERGDKTFTVPLVNTATVGAILQVNLSNLRVTSTTGETAILQIDKAAVTLNDDPPPPVQPSPGTPGVADNFIGFSSKTFSGSRNVGTATITVNRNGIRGAFTVDYVTGNNTALAGQDYQATTGTLSWVDGERGDKTFTVPLISTATVGSLLQISLNNLKVTSTTGETAALQIDNATLTITDDPIPADNVVSWGAKGYSAKKSDNLATVAVNRTGTQGILTVNYATVDGTAVAGQDYQSTNGTLSWANGEGGAKNLTVPLLTGAKGGNSFLVKLSNVQGTGRLDVDTTVISIVDDSATPTGATPTGTTPTGTTPTGTTPATGSSAISPLATGLGSGTAAADSSTQPVAPLVTGDVSSNLDAGGQTLTNNVTVTPAGSMTNATFAGDVVNNGSISNSIFEGNVQNNELISNSSLASGATLTGGTLTGAISSQGTISNIDFTGTKLSGGTLAGTITNSSRVGGIIENVNLAPNTTLTGGRIGGTITAADATSTLQNVQLVANTNLIGGTLAGNTTAGPGSTLQDVQFAAGATLKGGTLSGNISGNPKQPAQLTNVKIAPGTVLSNVTLTPPVTVPKDVVIGPGVTLPKEILKTLIPDNLSSLDSDALSKISPAVLGVLDAEQLAEIPPEALSGLSAEQLAALSPEAISALSSEQLQSIPPEALSGLQAAQMATLPGPTLASMTPEQFANVPPASLSGLTAQNMGSLSPAVLRQFTPTHVAALNPQAFQQLPGDQVGKLFNNLDADKVSTTEVQHLVPPGWVLNPTTGALTPPVGTLLSVRPLPANLPVQVNVPTLLDLKTGFGVGGKSDTSIEDGMKKTLDEVDLSQFILSQDEQGILQIKGTGEFTGVNFAFIPDPGEVVQVDNGTPVGLKVLDGGFYEMTTPDAHRFKITPSPKDPAGLSKVLEDGPVILGKRGDVFLTVPSKNRQGGGAREVAIFDPLIEPAAEGVCEEIAGKQVCDFSNASSDQQPGINNAGAKYGTRATKDDLPSKRVVYADGTSQVVHPTVLSPDVFAAQGSSYEGVESIKFQATGRFKFTYQGKAYVIKPSFGVKSRALDPGEEIKPSIAVKEGGTISYTITVDIPGAGVTRGRRESSGAREVEVSDCTVEADAEATCEEINGKQVCK